MLLTTRFSCRLLLMSVGQIIERGLAELVEAAGHRARVECTPNPRVRCRQSQGEPPDGHLWRSAMGARQPSMMQMAVFQRRCERLTANPGGYRLVMEHARALDGYGVVGSFGGVCGDLHRRVTSKTSHFVSRPRVATQDGRRCAAVTSRARTAHTHHTHAGRSQLSYHATHGSWLMPCRPPPARASAGRRRH